MPFPTNVYWQSFCKFLSFDTHKTCTKINMSIDTHDLDFDMQCDLWREKNHVIDTIEITMTQTTRHVTLRWHFRRKCGCQLKFIFVFENVTWHFGFEIKCHMNLSNIHIVSDPFPDCNYTALNMVCNLIWYYTSQWSLF